MIQIEINKANLYKFYFFILRAYYVLSALIALGLTFSDFEFFSFIITSAGLFVMGLQFYASLHAEEMIEVKDHNGFLLGLLLTIFLLPGLSLPLGLFGLYAFLNRAFRKAHLPEALPAWLYNFLLKFDQKVSRTFWHFQK